MPTSTNANAHETTLDVVYDNSLPKDYVNSSNILILFLFFGNLKIYSFC